MPNQVRFLDNVSVSAFGNTGGTETTSTGSLLLTASAATNIITFTKGDGTTFPVTIDTGSDVTTGSLITTASAALNVITFTKGDGTTFPITLDTGSTSISSSYATTSSFAQSGNGIFSGSFSGSFEGDGSGLTGVGAHTGSLMTTASAALNVITFTKGDGTTFPITVDTGSGSVGTSNEFQITDNAGGFVASILQETGGQIGIGGATTSSVFALDSITDKGFTLPTTTVAQRTAISSPIAGLQVHTEDGTDSIPYYNHSVDGWVPVGRYALKNAVYVNGSGTSTRAGNIAAEGVAGTGELKFTGMRWSSSGLFPDIDESTGLPLTSYSQRDLGYTQRPGRWRDVYAESFSAKSAGSDVYYKIGTFSGGTAGIGYTAGSSNVSGVSICSGDITQAVIKIFTGKTVKITDVTNNLHTLVEEDSAVLSLDSTTRGFLPPVMTTVEMNAIATPATGLMIYDETTNQWMGYDGTSWVIIG